MSTSRPGAATPLDVAPWESGAMLFTPLHTAKRDLLEVALVHQMTHASLASFRPWIEEGAAHFAQALQREQQQGRAAALEYMQQQVRMLTVTERMIAMSAANRGGGWEPKWRPPSLITTDDEVLYRTKAMFVWWMLRDMVGDAALRRALNAYKPDMDKSPAYVQSLVEKESGRQLEWFFDDWVYRGRGLPDFRITDAKARANLDGSFTVDLSIKNLGTASAEVPVTVSTEGQTVSKRVIVLAGDSEDLRVTVPAKPIEAIVNDGSVPEMDSTNNQAAIAAPES
jgi:aminopeptidase N